MASDSENWSSQKIYIIEKIRNGEYSIFEDASPMRKKDKDIVTAAVTHWGNLLKHADDIWKANKEIVSLAVTQFGGALHYASDELKADREIVKIAVAQDGESLRHASEDLREDQNIVLTAIKEDYSAFKYASTLLQEDKAFILAAVKEKGQILEYVFDIFKADKEVVLAAVMQHGQAFKHAAEELRFQKDIIVAALMKDGEIFDSTNHYWTSDREIMLAAASHGGDLFQYAADELKEDRLFVLEAVKVGGVALKYSSEALKGDKEVVQTAVAQNGSVLEYASSSLQADKEVVMAAILQNGTALEYASSDLRADEEVVMASVLQCGEALQHADEKWTSNIDIVRAAVKQDGLALRFASDECKLNKSVAMDAVQKAGNALKYVNWDLRKDKDIVISALSNESKAVRYVNSDFFEFGQIPQVFLDYLKNEEDGRAMLHEWVDNKYMPDRLKSLVRQDNDIADVKNADGKRAIDRAIPQCKEAMEIGMRLFGLYDVIDGPLLPHQNDTACMFRAYRHDAVTTDDGVDTKQRIPSVFKIMISADKVISELNARKGQHHMETSYILSVKAVHISSKFVTDAAKYDALGDAAAECGAILHPLVTKFMAQINGVISDRLVTEGQKQIANEDEGAVLVFDYADQTLDAALRYDRIASGDRPHLVKQIAKAMAKALLELHENGYIHGNLKPLNIVRIGDRWKTTDLDLSCPIGGKYSEKKPSSGYCPPEVVKKFDDLQSIDASVAHDLWSFGAILYHLETGRSLWQLDQDDNIVQEQMYDLIYWTKPSVRMKKFARVTFSTVSAKELVKKLLDPDPVRRCAHFQSSDGENYGLGEEMNRVLMDGYFDEDTKIFKALQSIQSDVTTIKQMSMTQEDELRKTREVLMHAIYEADEVQTPTTFVILKKKLPPPLSPEEEEALSHSFSLFGCSFSLEDIREKLVCLMQFAKTNDELSSCIKDPLLDKIQEIIDHISNEDLSIEDIKAGLKIILGECMQCIKDSGLSLDSDISDILEQLKPFAPLLEGSGISLEETMSQFEDYLDQANDWASDLASAGKMISEANPENFFDIVGEQFGGLLQEKFMYFYLVDELTGKPVRGDGYPIEIQTPGDFVPKVLPLMQASMRATSLVNGAAGVCQMFGFPVPRIPFLRQNKMNNSVEVMKMGSSVHAFSVVHQKVEDNDGKTESVRGASLRELERFLKQYDENDTFAGLRRIGDVDGGAIWTVLSDEGVKEQLEKRAKMREAEEQFQMLKLQAQIAAEKIKEQNESKIVSQSSSQNTQNGTSNPINEMHQNDPSASKPINEIHQNGPTSSGLAQDSLSSNAGLNGTNQVTETALVEYKPEGSFPSFYRLLNPFGSLEDSTAEHRVKILCAENETLKKELATVHARIKKTSKDVKAAVDVLQRSADEMDKIDGSDSSCTIS